MKRESISDALNLLDDGLLQHTEQIRNKKKKSKKVHWQRWGAIAACLCLIFIMVPSLSYFFHTPSKTTPSQENTPPIEPKAVVSISSLLAENHSDYKEQIEEVSTVPIAQYIGIYVKTASVESDILSESIGTAISGTKTWYYISGHTDLQYLIHYDDHVYSLWKFKCFDSDKYTYSEVLKHVYQIDSADSITKIQVNPATMDQTDSGKRIQEKIGIQNITNKDEIETVYEILSSLTCYGENHWDMIDYGNVEAASDEKTSSTKAVQLGRYLTLVTSYGNEIDGLKYTAVSNMFYEFSGIAYHKLTEKQAEHMYKILHIEQSEGIK